MVAVMTAGVCLQVSVAAPAPDKESINPLPEPLKEKVPPVGPVPPEGKAWVEESVMVDGAMRTEMAARDAAELRKRYLDSHRRIAEKLTVEELAEKCNKLRREALGLSAEDEIGQIQKQLLDLKQKTSRNKDASVRVQRAIEALEKAP